MRSVLLVLFTLVVTACGGTGQIPPTVLLPLSTPISNNPTHQPPGVSPTATSATSTVQAAKATSSIGAIESAATHSGGFPDAQAVTWQPVAANLNQPIGVFNAGDASNRLFVIEQKGIIRLLQDGKLLNAPFLDITDRVGTNGSERGLLGLAFHPNYGKSGIFYLNYTDKAGNTVIASFTVSSNNPNQADPKSEKRLLYVQQPFPNHNGGEMVFSPDGFLYIGLGDGGSGGDPFGNGQSLNTFLGKIIRIDVDHGQPYAIPPDNPFASGGGKPEIWAYGMRNPWRFSFDRQTGDLYIGDVGQDLWEEIDFLPAGSPGGSNFGWNYFEGTHPYSNQQPPPGMVFVKPVAEYSHDQGCSVTGGVVYRGQALPEWQGIYLYGDYCSGWIRGLYRNAQGDWLTTQLFENLGPIASFGEDEAGEVYLALHSGSILQLVKK